VLKLEQVLASTSLRARRARKVRRARSDSHHLLLPGSKFQLPVLIR
jgi:hypothetical protein